MYIGVLPWDVYPWPGAPKYQIITFAIYVGYGPWTVSPFLKYLV